MLVVADGGLNDLAHLHHRHVMSASNGEPGGTNKRHGRHGADLELRVPLGTCVRDVGRSQDDGAAYLIADLLEDGQRVVIAAGGCGGAGNTRFTTAVSREPRLAEAGGDGATHTVRLELKLPVDVAMTGLPNAGKSSLLATLSSARPRVAAYPFTTTAPVRGVIELGHRTLTAVDLPSLMEGAHAARGLGNGFLRHAERARIIAHVLDGSEPCLVERMRTINRELSLFSPALARRPQVIVVNKFDLPGVAGHREQMESELRAALGRETAIEFVSATEQTGTRTLLRTLFEAFDAAVRDAEEETPHEKAAVDEAAPRVPRPEQPEAGAGAVRVRDAFRITHPRAVRIARGSDLDDWTVRLQYHGELARLGLTRQLEELGVQAGDRVMVGDLEFLWE